jgi:hypothetical protein
VPDIVSAETVAHGNIKHRKSLRANVLTAKSAVKLHTLLDIAAKAEQELGWKPMSLTVLLASTSIPTTSPEGLRWTPLIEQLWG